MSVRVRRRLIASVSVDPHNRTDSLCDALIYLGSLDASYVILDNRGMAYKPHPGNAKRPAYPRLVGYTQAYMADDVLLTRGPLQVIYPEDTNMTLR